jgi:hypothetical protein
VRFYESVFPSCQGLGNSWLFDIHRKESFKLNADFDEEYVLHISNVTSSQEQGEHEISTTKVIFNN